MAIAQIGDLPDMPRPDDLEEAVIHQLDSLDVPEQPGGHWKIEDEGSADWALRKLSRVRAQTATVNALAARQIDAILAAVEPYLEPVRTWQEEQAERLAKEEAHWTGILVEYHRAAIVEDEKRLSIKLPHGTLSSRKSPDKWEFDEDAFLTWARQHAPELVRVKEEINKALVKRSLSPNIKGGALTAAGAVAQGVTVALGDRNFEVSTEELAQ